MSAIELQRKWDERGIKLLATIEAEGEIPAGSDDIPEEESTIEILEAWDDASGEDLDPATVLAARREEIAYYKAMGRSRRFRYHIALPEQGASQSEYNGETSTREIGTTSQFAADWWQRSSTTKCDDLFAGTPLLEKMRAIISMAASGATPKTLMTRRESCVHVRKMQE